MILEQFVSSEIQTKRDIPSGARGQQPLTWCAILDNAIAGHTAEMNGGQEKDDEFASQRPCIRASHWRRGSRRPSAACRLYDFDHPLRRAAYRLQVHQSGKTAQFRG